VLVFSLLWKKEVFIIREEEGAFSGLEARGE